MKEVLERIERIIEAILSTLASIGLFVLIHWGYNLTCDEPLTTANMGIAFMVSVLLVYCTRQALIATRYKRLEILADELEKSKDEEAEELFEHLKVK